VNQSKPREAAALSHSHWVAITDRLAAVQLPELMRLIAEVGAGVVGTAVVGTAVGAEVGAEALELLEARRRASKAFAERRVPLGGLLEVFLQSLTGQ